MAKIAAIFRYPVKSMTGESLVGITISQRGVEADRSWAVLDLATGRVASAKKPVIWRALLDLTAVGPAAGSHGEIRIQLPDGSAITVGDQESDERLSDYLGRRVRLISSAPADAEIERARPDEVLEQSVQADVAIDVSRLGRASPPGTFFDFAPVHLITTSSLAALQSAGAPPFEAARYRPNVLIDTGDQEGFVEDAWVGRELHVGDVRLRILIQTPRCAVPTLAHGGAGERPEAISSVMQRHRVELEGIGTLPCLGVYGQVVAGGPVRVGQPILVQ